MSFENSEMTTINITMDCIGSVEDLKCFSNPIFSLRNHINYIKDICVSYQTNDAIRNKTGEFISRIFTSGETFKDEEYEKFFRAALKKFKVDSPADFKSEDEKKKFFDYVDKNYKGEKSD